MKKTTPRHIIIKLQKTSDKEKNLISSQRNQDKNYWTAYFTYNNTSMNMMVATSTTLKSDDTGEYFELSNEFMNGDHVKSSNIKCLFVKNVVVLLALKIQPFSISSFASSNVSNL